MEEQQEHLLKSETLIDDSAPSLLSRRPDSRHLHRRLHFFLLYVVNALLVVSLMVLLVRREKCVDPSLKTYMPANDAVEWEETVFIDMPGEVSPYLGTPSDEIDELWDQLYTGTGFLLFDPEETRRMVEPTVAIPTSGGDSGLYGMEVFHELHCLNVLRKSLYPERYPHYQLWNENCTRNPNMERHLAHCIDRLRQGVQCAGNTGTHFYFWSEEAGHWKMDMRSRHTCRNFERLQEWARARDYTGFDPFVRSHSTADM
ncbi:hypothetical protein K491DRAFT_694507 [Lophiostoma macrostomum CBS 122681]|uniref:Tat pathway signal sequence n=1 Tax=Lophiostoma macrostomum CBS 122681 TaxID=1314788 RepID=A0A6A6T2Y3_9PLEO|nr:hypothetical protein K491DRAFT_694507 [Lophiostoma macrostomum CBS 122681]